MIVNIFKTAVLHHSKGNFSKAEEIYKNILNENPNDFAVLLKIMELYYHKHNNLKKLKIYLKNV